MPSRQTETGGFAHVQVNPEFDPAEVLVIAENLYLKALKTLNNATAFGNADAEVREDCMEAARWVISERRLAIEQACDSLFDEANEAVQGRDSSFKQEQAEESSSKADTLFGAGWSDAAIGVIVGHCKALGMETAEPPMLQDVLIFITDAASRGTVGRDSDLHHAVRSQAEAWLAVHTHCISLGMPAEKSGTFGVIRFISTLAKLAVMGDTPERRAADQEWLKANYDNSSIADTFQESDSYRQYNPDDIFSRVMKVRSQRTQQYSHGVANERIRAMTDFGKMVLILVRSHYKMDIIFDDRRAGSLGNSIMAAIKLLRMQWSPQSTDSYDDAINYIAMAAECQHHEFKGEEHADES